VQAPGRHEPLLLLLAGGLVAADALAELRLPVLSLAAIGLVAWRSRRWPRLVTAVALTAGLFQLAERASALVLASPAADAQRVSSKLAAVEGRAARLVSLLDASALRAAGLPDVPAALADDRRALSRLFQSLEQLREKLPEHPALAVHAVPLATVAWAGPAVDLRAFEGLAGVRRDVFVLGGSVTTTLVATAPVRDARGELVGLATAELPADVRRHIRNDFLTDFDRLTEDDPGLEVHYLDARYEAQGPRPFAPLGTGVHSAERLVRAPDGGVLAAVRATAPSLSDVLGPLHARARRALAALLALLLLAWLTTMHEAGSWRLRWAAAATVMRLLLLLLGLPAPTPGSPLLSPDIYASAPFSGLLRSPSVSSALAAFTRSPLDLLLTAAWIALLLGLLADRVLERGAPSQPHPRAWALYVLALPVLGLVFGWIADVSANCTLELETMSLVPETAAHLVLQLALLLILAAGAFALTALLSLAGPPPPGWAGVVRLAGVATAGVLAYRFWPRELLGLPLLPSLLLFLGAAGLAATRHLWRPALQQASPAARAGLALLSLLCFALLLYPTLVHYSEKNTRQQIERDHASLVLHQPQWREYVLVESQHRIDGLGVLEEMPALPVPPLIEELAFAVWSTTDLAAFGFSSAAEIQDAKGRVVSRFALNLPSVALPIRPLPATQEWETAREELPEASGGGRVLHSQRLLSYHGELHGAIHLYVRDDYWNLPFVRARDPYSVLYRTATRSAAHNRPVDLLVYDRARRLVFSSAERPPALDGALAGRLSAAGTGFWTTLMIDGHLEHTFLFGDGQNVYGLSYLRMSAGHFAADLVEAASGMLLVGLCGLLALVLVRTALRRPSLSLPSLVQSVGERFALRLFVAFVALAVIPVGVLDVVVRRFVSDRLHREAEIDALERAAVAKKAVEDFVRFRGGEAAGRQPSLDAGLVYVASLMRNDLDTFSRGRLLASSKGELYASGLLPRRVSGSVYRALILEGQTAALTTERIGTFPYFVVSVPVRLESSEPSILSIPLALRQREVDAVLQDLGRTIRLASVLFLAVAAALAHSMARRISGPIRQLTAATQRVARGDLTARVATTSRDELSVLVGSFNTMARDLDRQRRDLERSNRLAAWAELARQVAHEVKNPLTPIQLSAEHLRRVYQDASADFGATLQACTDTILKQVRILRGIVTEFSAFARPPAAVLELEDPAALLEGALAPYRTALPPSVRLAAVVETPLPPVRADRRLIERALVNLVENALQAVGDSGTIAVRARAAGGRVELEVEDSGPGVDPEIRERVFEPFFSTKTSGSGLGLALVKKIAEDHGGGITLESQPGRTRATLWLPVVAEEAQRGGDALPLG